MSQRLHPQKHAEPARRVNKEAIPIRGDVPRTDLIEEGEGSVDNVGIEGCDVDAEDDGNVCDEEDEVDEVEGAGENGFGWHCECAYG